MSKKKVALIFGGKSSEHDVSCVSAVTVAEALDKDKYEILSTKYGGHSFALENPKELSLIISQYFES